MQIVAGHSALIGKSISFKSGRVFVGERELDPSRVRSVSYDGTRISIPSLLLWTVVWLVVFFPASVLALLIAGRRPIARVDLKNGTVFTVKCHEMGQVHKLQRHLEGVVDGAILGDPLAAA